MKIHKNSSLTLVQRRKIKELYDAGNTSYAKLATRFCVSIKTIEKWVKRDNPEDQKSGPKNPKTVITPEYKKAVLEYRKDNPEQGPISIAFYIKKDFAFANRGTVLKILQSASLTKPKGKKNEAETA